MSLQSWRNSVVGKHIDIDGWYGAQCWDLWAHYAIYEHGAERLSTWTSSNAGADSGLASSVWLKFPAHPGIDRQFRKLGRHDAIRAGDVIVWGRSREYPHSHIAIATGAHTPTHVECVTQNDGTAFQASGATRVGWLTKGGMIGILRPYAYDPKPFITKEEEYLMSNKIVYITDSIKNNPYYRYNPISGTKRKIARREWETIRKIEAAKGMEVALVEISTAQLNAIANG